MKKWTIEEWKDNCRVNCTNSYSMAVNFEALCMKEFGAGSGSYVKGLSGAQDEMAQELAKKIPDNLIKLD